MNKILTFQPLLRHLIPLAVYITGELELSIVILCFLKLNCQISVMWGFSYKDIYSLYMNQRYMWDHLNIQDGALCDLNQQLKVINLCQKKLQLRCRAPDQPLHKSTLKMSFSTPNPEQVIETEVYVEVSSSYILIANQAPSCIPKMFCQIILINMRQPISSRSRSLYFGNS